MSKDTIYREDAIKALRLEYPMMPMFKNLREEWAIKTEGFRKAEEVIMSIPSADRPQGDFVSKRYLLAEIDDLADEFSEVDENGLHSERWCGILDSRGIIVNAPSVSDRPQGYYIKGENGEWYCSICKRIDDKYSVARFCWHCGARMKGADDGNK